jgi:acyl carrier protein
MPDTGLALRDDASLIDDLGFDSFAMVRLLLSLESEFGINFEDGHLDLANFSSIDAIAGLVDRYKTEHE